MNWEGAPQSLTEIYLDFNKITSSEMDWKRAPWDCEINVDDDVNTFEEYKKQRNNIPHLPHISMERKDLLIYPLISEAFMIPPGISKKKIFIKGGPSFHEDMKEAFDLFK
jgi:hypothetical protein